MNRMEVILYAIILGLVVNLIANMIWKYIPGSDKSIDKVVSAVLICICVLLVIFVKRDSSVEERGQKDETIQTNDTTIANTGVQIDKLETNSGNVNIENVQGNKIVVSEDNTTLLLKPLVFGEIDVGIPYGYFLEAIDKRNSSIKYNVYAQPTSSIEGKPNPHSQDIVLNFDIINPNSLELRIVGLYIDVLEYRAVEVLATHPVASAGETRKFFCNIKSRTGSYRCTLLSSNYDFIKIARGELENFGINVNTVESGVYKLALTIEYSIGGKSEKVEIGKLNRLVGFF